MEGQEGVHWPNSAWNWMRNRLEECWNCTDWENYHRRKVKESWSIWLWKPGLKRDDETLGELYDIVLEDKGRKKKEVKRMLLDMWTLGSRVCCLRNVCCNFAPLRPVRTGHWMHIESALITSELQTRKTKPDWMCIDPIHIWRYIESWLGWNVVGHSLHHMLHSVNFRSMKVWLVFGMWRGQRL